MTPEILAILFLFFFGTCVGSFVNVVVDRYDNPISILKGRSYCFSCKKKLTGKDLIPIFSYIHLRGKCRYCHGSIPKRIFFSEIAFGLLFVLVGLTTLPVWSNLVFILVISALLMTLFFIDLEHGILPDYILVVLFIVSFLYIFPLGIYQIGINIIVGLVAFTVFLLLYLITKGRGIGFGDVKFVFVIGFLLGYPSAALAIYFSFVIGAVVALFLILTGKKHLRGDTIPFGPFLVIGTLVMLLFSETVYSLIQTII